MKILGIDPGLQATGYGVIEMIGGPGALRLLETGVIEPKRSLPLPQKVDKIFQNITALVGQYQPEVMVLEKLYAHYKHPATGVVMGHARGVICLAAAQCGVTLVEYSVKRIRKALVGNGNASKPQTRESVARHLKIDATCLTLDASDALALALGFVYMQKAVRTSVV